MSEARAAQPLRFFQSVLGGWFSMRLFPRLIRLVIIGALLGVVYSLFYASDRYVSEANVVIRKTDSVSTPSFDIPLLASGISGVTRPDQLLLRDYLLSMDMFRKLDTELGLRAHYSDSSRDIVSRMWLTDAPMEWFRRYFLTRVSVVYDDFAGVLRIDVQAYDAPTAHAISAMMVKEGERYMNQLGHELAQAQVDFLTHQVDVAKQRFLEASQVLLKFQNEKGLLSPQATAESLTTLIGELEAQRAQLQTQLAALPKSLDRSHPNILMLQQSIAAVDRQIAGEKARLTSRSGGRSLNVTLEEFQRLQLEVSFTQDIYKSSITALEKGRIDAARLLEKVSVLQSPTLPEYPMEPRRLYDAFVTLLVAGILVGILKLLENIVRDHVD